MIKKFNEFIHESVNAKKQKTMFEAFNHDEFDTELRMCLNDVIQSYYYDVLDAKLNSNNEFEISFIRIPNPLLSTISQMNDMWNEWNMEGDSVDLEVNDSECFDITFEGNTTLSFVENTAYWTNNYIIDFEKGMIKITGKLNEDFLQKKGITVGDITGLK